MGMGKLIALELRRIRLRPYHLAAGACGAAMLAFLYLMAAIPRMDPADGDTALLASYDFLLGLTQLVFLAVFTVFAGVMSARFVVEGYSGTQALLLFSYPVSRRKVLLVKLAVALLYPAAAMFLWGTAAQGVFFLTEALLPLCPDTLTAGTVLWSLCSLLCRSLLAGLLGLMAAGLGLWRRSIPTAIISALLLSCLACQGLSALLPFRPAMGLALIAGAVPAAWALRYMIRQVDEMEV